MNTEQAIFEARTLNDLSPTLDLDGQVRAAELVAFFAGVVEAALAEHRRAVAGDLVWRIG